MVKFRMLSEIQIKKKIRKHCFSKGASWSSGLTRYTIRMWHQGSAVRISAFSSLFFFRRSDSFDFLSLVTICDTTRNEGALMKRQKTRKRGTPAGRKGGSGDKKAGAAIKTWIRKRNLVIYIYIRRRKLVREQRNLIKWSTPMIR